MISLSKATFGGIGGSTLLVYLFGGGKKFYPYQPFIQIKSPSASLPAFHSRLHISAPQCPLPELVVRKMSAQLPRSETSVTEVVSVYL